MTTNSAELSLKPNDLVGFKLDHPKQIFSARVKEINGWGVILYSKVLFQAPEHTYGAAWSRIRTPF